MIRILVVCMGNICRSPLAASVLQSQLEQSGLANRIAVDSAGTHAGHLGEKADPRAVAVASAQGYQQIHRERARRVNAEDFAMFDLLLAMDGDNLGNLHQQCPPEHAHKLHLFLEFAGEGEGAAVPDPYYGNAAGFERVMVLCEAGARGVLRRLASVAN
jgi:protein-tyrosine phosphatase